MTSRSTSLLMAIGVLCCAVSAAELKPLRVTVPAEIRPLPEGSDRSGATPGFKFRGTKGYAWLPEQYIAEIPIMAKYRMNFLMNCYSSLWELGERGKWVKDRPMNFWYKALPDRMKREFEEVVKASQKNGIQFCFSMNPNLESDRPLDYNSKADLDALWQHYAWMQDLGVKWFNISLDDITKRIDAGGQATLVNEMLRRLRARDPEAQVIFCPSWYGGTGQAGKETSHVLGAGDTPGVRYTRTLAEKLHPDVYIFWTGPEVFSMTVTRQHAEAYRALVRHRLFLWDNYPVNDQEQPLHLGPLTGRDATLPEVIDGYMSNPLGFQNEANRIPLLTIADYTWNPRAYDPWRSLGQAIAHLGKTQEEREALRDLVELYPGRLWDGTPNWKFNSLRGRFADALKRNARGEAQEILARAESTSRRLAAVFPNAWPSGRQTLENDVRAMRAEYGGGAAPARDKK